MLTLSLSLSLECGSLAVDSKIVGLGDVTLAWDLSRRVSVGEMLTVVASECN